MENFKEVMQQELDRVRALVDGPVIVPTWDAKGIAAGETGIGRDGWIGIRFNRTLFEAMEDKDIQQVTAHEYAHVMVGREWQEAGTPPGDWDGPGGHGPRWERYMGIFGKPALQKLDAVFSAEVERKIERERLLDELRKARELIELLKAVGLIVEKPQVSKGGDRHLELF